MAARHVPASTSPFFPSDARERLRSASGTSVAETLIELLHHAGVRRIYGVAGDALNGLTDALRRDGRIEWIGCRHEENAAYAAFGEAQVTGGLGVCAGTVGPGALHLINGLYNAKREGASVLVITGQVPASQRGTGYFQEVELGKVFDDVCSYQAVISSAAQMARLSEIAIQKSLSEKIVTRIEIPIDVMTLEVPDRKQLHPLVCSSTRLVPPEEELRKAARILDGGKKVALFCGDGCRSSVEDVLALSERLHAPIAHTLRAKDIFDERHPNVMGMTGLIGTPPGYHAVLDCDVLLMLGTNFPYDDFLPTDAAIIQVDNKIENIGRRAPVTLGLIGDVGETTGRLLPAVRAAGDSGFLRHLVRMKERSDERLAAQASFDRSDEPLHPQVIASALDRIAANDAAFAVDVGESTVWVARYMRMRERRRMVGSFNHGSMGCALPIALGIAAADPSRQAWALCGDGGFAMSMQDLVTAVRFEWPIKVLVFNNSELGFVKMENEVSGYPLFPPATGLVNPDFAEVAKACGATGFRVERASDIEPALKSAILARGPVLIDAIVTPGELTLPPKVGLAQAWGFGKSKIKEGLLGLRGDHEQWTNWKREFDSNLRKH